jgi:cyclin-dependent kinase 12/13
MGCVISREAPGIVSEVNEDKNLSSQSSRKVDDVPVRKVDRNDVEVQNGGIKKEEKIGGDGGQRQPGERRRSRANPRLSNLPKQSRGEQIVVGWPPWLTDACGEALQGLIPRRADTFEKIDKVRYHLFCEKMV